MFVGLRPHFIYMHNQVSWRRAELACADGTLELLQGLTGRKYAKDQRWLN